MGFKVKNSPFFIKDLALGDTIDAVLDEYKKVKSWSLIQSDGNSTAWIYVRRKKSDVIDNLVDCGCLIEGEPVRGVYSVSIPREIDIKTVDDVLLPYKRKRAISVAFPAFRHVDG